MLQVYVYEDQTGSFFNVNFILFHGLRGSASPVLTATGFVNGRGQF